MVELMFSLVHPFLQTVTLQISWESWMFSRKPSNYDAILGSVSSIAFSRRRKECANMVELMFSLVHPFLQTVTLQISWESWMFSRNPSKYDAILSSVSSIAFSRCRKECANMGEWVFSLVHPFVQTVTLQKSWESWMFFEKPIEM